MREKLLPNNFNDNLFAFPQYFLKYSICGGGSVAIWIRINDAIYLLLEKLLLFDSEIAMVIGFREESSSLSSSSFPDSSLKFEMKQVSCSPPVRGGVSDRSNGRNGWKSWTEKSISQRQFSPSQSLGFSNNHFDILHSAGRRTDTPERPRGTCLADKRHPILRKLMNPPGIFE